MRFSRKVALGAAALFLLTAGRVPAQSAPPDSTASPAARASATASNDSVSSRQGKTADAQRAKAASTEPDNTLTIAPRFSVAPPEPKAEATSARNRNKASAASKQVSVPSHPARLPYIGITVRDTTELHEGYKEKGLEILEVDPGSPAAKAGLRGRIDMSSIGVSMVTAGAMLAPLGFITEPLLAKSGALGRNGDLIVAVDDHRVINQRQFQQAISGLKQGETVYLTVVRTVHDSRKTLKLAVHLGKLRYANADDADTP